MTETGISPFPLKSSLNNGEEKFYKKKKKFERFVKKWFFTSLVLINSNVYSSMPEGLLRHFFCTGRSDQ